MTVFFVIVKSKNLDTLNFQNYILINKQLYTYFTFLSLFKIEIPTCFLNVIQIRHECAVHSIIQLKVSQNTY